MIFLYPLGMPLITLAVIILVGFAEGPAFSRYLFAFMVSVILAAILGPAVTTNAGGAFALPWWINLGGTTISYVVPYTLIVLVACVLLTTLVSAVRNLGGNPR